MGHDLLEALLVWVHAHPVAALALVFAVALGESLFIFGLLIPGALFMFAFGALIGADALPLGATFAAAVAGTLVGDGASYALGRGYRGRVHDLPGLGGSRELIARAEEFLARHGGKGIIVGRLIGALRPIMPTVAGAAGLSPRRFAIMDIVATAAWAPCYILPGIVFGASLDLAAQVAGRLAMLLLLVVAIVWVTTVTARYTLAAGRVAGRRYAERLLSWSQRHRRLGLLGPALADPRQPELPALAVAAALLMIVTGVLYMLVWGWHRPVYPIRFDALVFYLSQGLHTSISDGVARAIAEVGSPLVYLSFAAAVAGLLAAMGNWRPAGHWVAAVGFSALVTLLLRWWLAIPAPVALFQGATPDPLFLTGGGQDLMLCATVYGLAGMIVGSRQPPALRPYYDSVTVGGIVLIALARLYLGIDWASDLIVGLPMAFIWLNLIGLSYRRQRLRPVQGTPVMVVLAGFVVIAILLATLPESTARQQPRPDRRISAAYLVAGWTGRGFQTLDAHIQDIAGRASAPLNLQAAGDAPALRATLATAGWQAPPRLGPSQPLQWLAPDVDLGELAVLPRIHDGRQPTITLIRDTSAKRTPATRMVLRLWPTRYVTRRQAVPLWVGLVDYQRVYRRFDLLATAADQQAYAAALHTLGRILADAGIGHRMVGPTGASRLLFWSRAPGVDAKVAPD